MQLPSVVRGLLITTAAALAAPVAHAQLVVGPGTNTPGSPGAIYVDVATGETSPLYPLQTTINALADDPLAERLHVVSVFVQRFWDYFEPFQQSIGFAELTKGLTMAKGRLVAFQTSGSGGPGLYRWTTSPPFVTTSLMSVPLPFFDPGGLGYDAAGDRFYLASSPATNAPPAGLYELDAFGAQSVTRVAPWPAALGTALGCAVGGGKVWVLGSGPQLFAFDLATKTWDPPVLANPSNNPFEGGLAWAPRLQPPISYCAAKTNSLGCTPAIAFSGRSSASVASGFVVRARSVLNQGVGFLLYGVGGRAALPFQGGTLCLASSVQRTPARMASGPGMPPSCFGSLSIDINSFAAGKFGGAPLPALRQPGQRVVCQWWSRDAAASFGSGLTNALEYTVRQ